MAEGKTSAKNVGEMLKGCGCIVMLLLILIPLVLLIVSIIAS